MESVHAAGDQQEVVSDSRPRAEADVAGVPQRSSVERRLADLRTTKGGAGVSAGATPKKAYRPSASTRPRPAGKKPDKGPH